jgi:uncharacterized membrane protein HdeD (DUF308 family)
LYTFHGNNAGLRIGTVSHSFAGDGNHMTRSFLRLFTGLFFQASPYVLLFIFLTILYNNTTQQYQQRRFEMFVVSRLKPLGYFLGIALMILGAAFIAMPGEIVGLITILVGAVLLLYGLFRSLAIIFKWDSLTNRVLPLSVGLVLMAAGLYVLLNTRATIHLTGIVLGVFAILLAVDRFLSAQKMRGRANIKPAILFGVIHLAFGIGLIYASLQMFSVIVILYGVYLFAAGLMAILSLRLFNDF